MHRVRVPLIGAIGLLALLVFVAVSSGDSVNQEKIWIIIGINFVLVVIGIIKAIANYIPPSNSRAESTMFEQNHYKSIISENISAQQKHYNSLKKLKLGLKNNEPDAYFAIALLKAKEAKTEIERKKSLDLIIYASENGSLNACDFLDKIKDED